MIVEGIVTTQNSSGEVNVAAMGPIVDPEMQSLLLRPFNTTTTYQNLVAQPTGVFHVVDDVELLVRAALNMFEQAPPVISSEKVLGHVLTQSCRWYEFEVREMDDSSERTEIKADIVHMGKLKDFFGFNRAKHAVIEYAILASRLFMLTEKEVREQQSHFKTIIEKTAGPTEERAFELVTQYVVQKWPQFMDSSKS